MFMRDRRPAGGPLRRSGPVLLAAWVLVAAAAPGSAGRALAAPPPAIPLLRAPSGLDRHGLTGIEEIAPPAVKSSVRPF